MAAIQNLPKNASMKSYWKVSVTKQHQGSSPCPTLCESSLTHQIWKPCNSFWERHSLMILIRWRQPRTRTHQKSRNLNQSQSKASSSWQFHPPKSTSFMSRIWVRTTPVWTRVCLRGTTFSRMIHPRRVWRIERLQGSSTWVRSKPTPPKENQNKKWLSTRISIQIRSRPAPPERWSV